MNETRIIELPKAENKALVLAATGSPYFLIVHEEGVGAHHVIKEKFDYDNCRNDYQESLNKLRKRKIDVFIGNHVWNNDTEAKSKILKETGENRFIDSDVWYKFLDFCEKRLHDIIENENKNKN